MPANHRLRFGGGEILRSPGRYGSLAQRRQMYVRRAGGSDIVAGRLFCVAGREQQSHAPRRAAWCSSQAEAAACFLELAGRAARWIRIVR
jgi:hypothetical protein